MARTKFSFEKRQRELARQQKQKEKAARRAEAKRSRGDQEPHASGEEQAGSETGAPRPALDERSDPGDGNPR